MTKSTTEYEISAEEKIKDFSEMLKEIDTVSDKRKKLWREIYENALADRQNAYVLFSTLVEIVEDKSTEHAIHGKMLSTYIERMSKANDQLIKLSELIADSENVKANEDIDPEEMFRKINTK
jgi:hypothetical protein